MANINRLASSMGMGSKVDYGDGCCPPICSSEKSPAYTSCMQIVDAHLEPPLARPMIRSGSRDRNCPKRDAFFYGGDNDDDEDYKVRRAVQRYVDMDRNSSSTHMNRIGQLLFV